MKTLVIAVLVTVALLGIAAPSQAWHHPWHYYGWGPWPYGYAPVVAPPVVTPPVVIQQQPQVYTQQPATQESWYWCRTPEGYYPYVQQCPGGWLQVIPSKTPPQ